MPECVPTHHTVAMEIDEHVISTMDVGIAFKDYPCKINSVDFHQSHDLLVTTSDDESIRLYDTAHATLLKTINSKKYGVDKICFTHHTDSVLYSSKNGWDESLRYLSLHDNRYLRYFKGHRDRVVSLCMCPQSDFFLSASLDHTVRLWDVRNYGCQALLRVRGRPSVVFDPRGLTFAISMDGGAIKLYDIRCFDKGPFDTFLLGDDTAVIADIKFSDDGRLMLLSSMTSNIYVLDAFSGKKLHAFMLELDPENGTLEASFSPEGQFIISGSGDDTIHVWSTKSGHEVVSWRSYGGVPAIVKWAPQRLMFASASHVLALWIPYLSKCTFSLAPNVGAVETDTMA